MAGVVAVWAEAPPFRSAGKLNVLIDGKKAGEVRQGQVAEFTAEEGRHTVRVRAGGSRSNSVTVTVRDDTTCRVVSTSTGLSAVAVMVPILGLVMSVVPGLVFRLRRHHPRPAQAAAPAQTTASAPGEGGASGYTGLWWESDPVLAKRFRKSAGPGGSE